MEDAEETPDVETSDVEEFDETSMTQICRGSP